MTRGPKKTAVSENAPSETEKIEALRSYVVQTCCEGSEWAIHADDAKARSAMVRKLRGFCVMTTAELCAWWRRAATETDLLSRRRLEAHATHVRVRALRKDSESANEDVNALVRSWLRGSDDGLGRLRRALRSSSSSRSSCCVELCRVPEKRVHQFANARVRVYETASERAAWDAFDELAVERLRTKRAVDACVSDAEEAVATACVAQRKRVGARCAIATLATAPEPWACFAQWLGCADATALLCALRLPSSGGARRALLDRRPQLHIFGVPGGFPHDLCDDGREGRWCVYVKQALHVSFGLVQRQPRHGEPPDEDEAFVACVDHGFHVNVAALAPGAPDARIARRTLARRRAAGEHGWRLRKLLQRVDDDGTRLDPVDWATHFASQPTVRAQLVDADTLQPVAWDALQPGARAASSLNDDNDRVLLCRARLPPSGAAATLFANSCGEQTPKDGYDECNLDASWWCSATTARYWAWGVDGAPLRGRFRLRATLEARSRRDGQPVTLVAYSPETEFFGRKRARPSGE